MAALKGNMLWLLIILLANGPAVIESADKEDSSKADAHCDSDYLDCTSAGKSKMAEIDLLQLPLATIDMTEAAKDPEKAAATVATALHDVGFLYLVNIPGFNSDELLETTKWFFNLPLDVKMDTAKSPFQKGNKNHFRGYYPVIPGGTSYKEAFEVGGVFSNISEYEIRTVDGRPLMRDVVGEPNVWPQSGTEPEYDAKFVEVMTYNYHFYTKLAHDLLQLISLGLGLDGTYFDNIFQPNPLSTLRLLHYPTRADDKHMPEDALDGTTVITTAAHFDSSFITLLATFDNWGLQIEKEGQWVDVPPVKDSMVVNIGDLLSLTLERRAKATSHRVIDLGGDRYSVPFFFECDFDADISKTIEGHLVPGLGGFHRYGPWMTNRTSQFAEYRTTDFGILD